MDDITNRYLNADNIHQNHHLKVLCVCSAGLFCSPSIAHVLSNDPYNCNCRAAGCDPGYALIPVDRVLVHWADEIVCADLEHVNRIKELLKENGEDKPVYVLCIPDRYKTRETRLLQLIRERLDEFRFVGTQS